MSIGSIGLAIMPLPSDYLMEFLVDDRAPERSGRGDTSSVRSRCGIERQWTAAAVPPTNQLTPPARYCLQDAPNCRRFLSPPPPPPLLLLLLLR